MSQFHDFLLMKSLKLKFERSGAAFDSLSDTDDSAQITQVCAKLPRHLSERIDQVCSVLDCTKRQFIEYALSNACDDASDMFTETGLFAEDSQS